MKNKIGIIFFVFLFYFGFVCAVENRTDEEIATTCLQESRETLSELHESGFSVQRVNDSLKEAISLFDAQVLLKVKRGGGDFSLIPPYCDRIVKNKEDAYKAKDGVEALILFYEETISDDMNSSSVDDIIFEIEYEIETERYEKVEDLLDKAYNEIVDVRSRHTALNLFYKSTTRGFKDFLVDYWKLFLLVIVVLFILFILYHNTIKKWNIKRTIQGLEIKKRVLKMLIQRVQKDYFEGGDVSERDYNIKTKKFAEMIRDIDRQIPLLREKFIKIDKGPINGRESINGDRAIARKNLLVAAESKKIKKFRKKIVPRKKSRGRVKKR